MQKPENSAVHSFEVLAKAQQGHQFQWKEKNCSTHGWNLKRVAMLRVALEVRQKGVET